MKSKEEVLWCSKCEDILKVEQVLDSNEIKAD